MYVNMNLNRNAVLSCTRLALSHQPPLPPPAVLTDYYYGNPLAYACKKKTKKRLRARQGEVSTAPPRA